MALLRKYVDVFAWTYDEMPGLDPRLVVHSLNMDPGVKLDRKSTRLNSSHHEQSRMPSSA